MEPRITDKRTIAERYGNKAIMEKKPQQSTKYKNITQVVDTGKTIKDVQFISDQLVSKRKSEMFKRIKSSTIIKLLNQNTQTESIYNLGNEVENMPIDDSHSVVSSKTANTAMSHKTTVTAVTYATEMLGNLSEIDFILLDLREESDYKDYHIKEAFSFPGVQISRDKFLSQMIMMKNKESKMIIVYHNDERNGVPYAALLFQKGFDNIYFLSGGIEEFVKKYPEYTEGPKRDILINMKIAREKAEEEAMMKKTGMAKSKYHLCGSSATTGVKQTGTKNQSSHNQSNINTLKQNLAKK